MMDYNEEVAVFGRQSLASIIDQFNWVTATDTLPKQSGSYVLVLHLNADKLIQVGKIGRLRCRAGRYYYVGSAMGPGGLASRVGRHFRNTADKKLRWHIDYLRAHMSVVGCWIMVNETRIECEISEMLSHNPDLTVMSRVGSSDCLCAGHVYFAPQHLHHHN